MDTKDQTNCKVCGTNYYANGDNGYCNPCIREVKTEIANYTVLQHLWYALVWIFNFQFVAALGSLGWAIERLFSIGDYNPRDGFWYTSGILKRRK